MTRVRIGVIGCGDIAQIQHLPNLAMLNEEFEVAVVCDISPSLAKYVAEWFHVPRYVTDYREVLSSEVDAVLLCHTDPKTEVAIAAFDAGKHVIVEKPVCTSLQEADAIIAAGKRSGKVGMAAYMKAFDPAFEVAKAEVDTMKDTRFVQVNHLHPDNALHLRNFQLVHFDDIPADAKEENLKARKKAVYDAIGEVAAQDERAFGMARGMIHDIYGMRLMLGMPKAVISTEVWNNYGAITTILEYPDGSRCVASRVNLPHLWYFKETLEVYGDSKRVTLTIPTGFSRGILSHVSVQGIDHDGTTYRTEPAVLWESAFTRELRHFHECITRGTTCLTSLESARQDVQLIIDIAKSYITHSPVPV